METGEVVEFSTLWIQYCCISKKAIIGNRWSSTSDEFNVAKMRINLKLASPTQYCWKQWKTKINKFLQKAQENEIQKLREVLSFMTNDGLQS